MNEILWEPANDRYDASTMAGFERFLKDTKGLSFDDYNAMWRWSVDDLDAFWGAIWEFFDVQASAPYTKVMAKRQMPGTVVVRSAGAGGQCCGTSARHGR